MLKREYRLRKKYMFNYCYNVGKVVHGKSILLYYTPSKNKNIKVGISVSKKVGTAVKRNRARRVIRSAITPFLDCLNQNYNIIIVARQNILTFSFSDISHDLSNLFKKAELLNGKKE